MIYKSNTLSNQIYYKLNNLKHPKGIVKYIR